MCEKSKHKVRSIDNVLKKKNSLYYSGEEEDKLKKNIEKVLETIANAKLNVQYNESAAKNKTKQNVLTTW